MQTVGLTEGEKQVIPAPRDVNYVFAPRDVNYVFQIGQVFIPTH